jgi:RNA polymerase sigma-70 factor (ECF subfamily)
MMAQSNPARLRLARSEPDADVPGVPVEAASGRGSPGSTRDAAAFERLILTNLDAAHNLAWWLTRNDDDASDVVQEACLKAWGAFSQMHSENGKAWLLAIVRTTAYSRMRKGREDETLPDESSVPGVPGPAAEMLRRADGEVVREAMGRLSSEQREVLVLCDLEGLSYAQIGLVIGVPAGTVMSRLSRARDALRRLLAARLGKE